MTVADAMNAKYALMDARWDEDRLVFAVADVGANLIDVMPMLFTAAIVVTPKAFPLAYTDRWCYQSVTEAIAAAEAWVAAGPTQREPDGWHRHPPTGRRRPHGDPSSEYINH
jgi:hypothetical protein